MAKFYPGAKLDTVLHFIEGAVALGLISGAIMAAIVGQLILGGMLGTLAIGMFLRLKRGRLRK